MTNTKPPSDRKRSKPVPPPTPAPSPAVIADNRLRAMREIVEQGWTQQFYEANRHYPIAEKVVVNELPKVKHGGTTHYCMVGAACRALFLPASARSSQQRVTRDLLRLIAPHIPDIDRTSDKDPDQATKVVLQFNDRADTTQQKVLAVLDATIEANRAHLP